MDIRVESFERGIERKKLGKGYWVFVIFVIFFTRICN